MTNEQDIDVVGFGALNLDLIAEWDEIPPEERDEILQLVSLDRERTTEDLNGFLRAVTPLARSGALRAERGGSAFNTVHALAAMRLGVNLGYVGVAAPPPRRLVALLGSADLPLAREALDAAGIDSGGVCDGQPPGGLSLSVVHGPTRSLRTVYDKRIVPALEARADELHVYLRRARHIHLTSLFGPGTEVFVANLVESVLDSPRRPSLSVDPGETWARSAGPSQNGAAVARLLELADLIFVNREELTCLTGSDDEDGARALLERYSRGRETKLLLLKSVTSARCFSLGGDGVIAHRSPQRVLPPPRIADSTGAGDVFAAGVLAGLFSDRGRTAAAMGLGLAASRRKIQFVGSEGYKDLDRVILGSPDPSPGRLFLSHSFQDESLGRAFVDLVRLAGVPSDRVFCTAQRSTGPRPGRPLNSGILRALKSSVLLVMLASPGYLASAFCRYEVGAAWALGVELFPLLVPPASVADLTDLTRGDLVCRVDERADLGALRSRLGELGLIERPAAATWDEDVSSFLERWGSIRGGA